MSSNNKRSSKSQASTSKTSALKMKLDPKDSQSLWGHLANLTERMQATWLDTFVHLTSLPTAAGQEQAVVMAIDTWVKARPSLKMSADEHGNLVITNQKAQSKAKSKDKSKAKSSKESKKAKADGIDAPVYFTAHMDHPAFVVERPDGEDGQGLVARFMGGVRESYFKTRGVRLWRQISPASQASSSSQKRLKAWKKGKFSSLGGFEPGPVGRVEIYTPPLKDRWYPVCLVRFDEPIQTRAGDILTWDLPDACVDEDQLIAPAIDDLGGLAAALCALDAALVVNPRADVRVLLTRAEEIGFLGAIAAAKSGTVSKDAKLICLETSKALEGYAPIGEGPILRVGDKTGTFDRELTEAVGRIANRLVLASQKAEQEQAALSKRQRATGKGEDVAGGGSKGSDGGGFGYQRKLMDGGTCEATTFCALGYQATCCCVPLGQYHNMDEKAGVIASESIAVRDFVGLVQLLVASALCLPSEPPAGLTDLMDRLIDQRDWVLK